MTATSIKFVAILSLLVLELELLVGKNYDIRTELRALVPVPLYHSLLAFLTILLIMWRLSPAEGLRIGRTLNLRGALINAGYFLLLNHYCRSLYVFSRSFSDTGFLVIWLAAGLLLLATWLTIWLPIRQWKTFATACWKHLAVALICSLGLPYLAAYTSESWLTFSRLTFSVTQQCLDLIYSDTIASPDDLKLGTPNFSVEILPGCSGYEGIGLVAGLLGIYLWVKSSELRFPQALLLIPLGIAASWTANILRLVCLIYIGSEFSPEAAMIGFHSQAGWLSFSCISLLLIYCAETSRLFRKQTVHEVVAEADTYPALPYLSPFLAMLFGGILANATSTDFNSLYFIKPLLTALVLTSYTTKYRQILHRPDWKLSIVTGVLVYCLWIALDRPFEARSPFDVLSKHWPYLWIAGRLCGAILIVPLTEELAFRGYLVKRVQNLDFEQVPDDRVHWPAILVSSVAFGSLHGNWLGGILSGIGFSLIATSRGGLANAIVAHMIANLCIALQALTLGDWWLWS